MSVEKRMMVAVAVSFVVIVIWTMFLMPANAPQETAANGSAEDQSQVTNLEQTEPAEKAAGSEADQQDAGETTGTEQDIAEAQSTPEDQVMIADSLSTVTVETNRYVAELTNEFGGSFASFKVKRPDGSGDFYESSFTEQPLDLVADSSFAVRPFAMMGSLLRDGNGNYSEIPGDPVIQGFENGSTIVLEGTEDLTVTFSYRDPEIGRLIKTFTFRNDTYIFDVRVDSAVFATEKNERIVHAFGPGVGDLLKELENGAYEPAREGNSFVVRKGSEGVNRMMSMVRERGPLGAEEEALKEQPMADMLSWAGLENNYFMTLAFSQRGEGFIPVYRIVAVEELKGGAEPQHYEFPLMGFQTFRDAAAFKVYAGPKDLEVLEKASNQTGEKLEDVISFGWFSFISRPALWILKQIHSFTQNYGFAIILLTVFINILLLPLIVSQRKSMSAMQKLQPQIKSLQAKYKVEKGDEIKVRQDKKQKLNEEMMALYKRENVNPMGGCLPLLIQMPILLALFDMFRVAIELRKAPFILWWDNLSTSDPTFVLPILMGLAMFVQQRMTPTPADSQAGALKILPFVFVFLFASAPSGLVLYWFTSSLFNLGTQAVMNQLDPVKKKQANAGAKQGGKKSKKKGKK